jgi:hypothetical protein
VEIAYEFQAIQLVISIGGSSRFRRLKWPKHHAGPFEVMPNKITVAPFRNSASFKRKEI